jgi:GNAT superfamily N-acetyltransferase
VSASVRRCTTDDELARSLEIYNTVWPHRAVTADDVAAWKRAALATVEFIATVDGEGAGSAAASRQRERPEACFALVTVLAENRRRGLGSLLYAAVSGWARERGLGELETFVDAEDEASLAFAARRGFKEHAREVGLALDVAHAARRRLEPPHGIRIVTLLERPDLAAGTYDVQLEASPDVPGYEDWKPPPRKLWVDTHLFRPSAPPDAVVLALAEDDEVVGYAKLSLSPDGRSARHNMTGVKRAWRGRGIAMALKRAQIEWAREHGIERLTTTNELRNGAMRRVNELLGYVDVPGRVTLRGPLSTSESGRNSDTLV